MPKRSALVAAFLAGLCLVLVNAVVIRIVRGGNEPVDSPSVAARAATPAPQVSAAAALQIALREAGGARALAAPELVQSERGLAWQVLTERGAVLVDAQSGAVLYRGLTQAVTPTPAGQPQRVLPSTASDAAVPGTADAFAVSAEQAAAIAQQAVPGAAVSGTPELVLFQGTPAYEVVLDAGVVYVDAQSGAVLFSEVVPAQEPWTTGRGESDHERDEHEAKRDEHERDEHGDD